MPRLHPLVVDHVLGVGLDHLASVCNLYTYTYIYIERERDIHTHIHMYIYIYICHTTIYSAIIYYTIR